MRSIMRSIEKLQWDPWRDRSIRRSTRPRNLGTPPPTEIGPESGTRNLRTREPITGNPGTQRATKIGGELSPNVSTAARTFSVQAVIGDLKQCHYDY
eukprot:844516-Pyramimonas_sp.AAC.1